LRRSLVLARCRRKGTSDTEVAREPLSLDGELARRPLNREMNRGSTWRRSMAGDATDLSNAKLKSL
jgi:hypothetical protein